MVGRGVGALAYPRGVMDLDGNKIVPQVYRSIYYAGNGWIMAGILRYPSSSMWVSFNIYDSKTGETIDIPPYKRLLTSNDLRRAWNSPGERLLRVTLDYDTVQRRGEGFIDITGREVIPLIYDWVNPFSYGTAVVVYNREVGLINTYNELLIPFGRYTEIVSFNNALVTAVKVGTWEDPNSIRWGFVDIEGNEIVPPIYRNVGRRRCWMGVFRNGFAEVQCAETELWGMIDTTGREVVPLAFDYIRPFNGRFTLANTGGVTYELGKGTSGRFGGTWYLINRQGHILASFEYASMKVISDTLIGFAEEITFIKGSCGCMTEPAGSWGIISVTSVFDNI